MKRRRLEELDSPSLKLSKLQTLMQFLVQHRTPHTSIASASSLLVVIRLMQLRGTMTEILTSHVFFSFASNINSVSASGVSLLLSALYDSEICNQPFMSDRKQQQTKDKRSTIACEYESIVSKQEMGLQPPKNINGNASSAILCFVERLLLVRYSHLAMIYPFHSVTHESSDTPLKIIDTWVKSNEGLTATSLSSNGLQNDDDDGISYIPPLVFMMAYRTLRKRLALKSFTENIDASASYEFRNYLALQNVAEDPVVNAALRVIFISKCLASSLVFCGKDRDIKFTSEYVLNCFEREMNIVDSFVKSVQDAKGKDGALAPIVGLHRDEKDAESGKEMTSTVNRRIEKTNSYFQKLWEKMQADEISSENDVREVSSKSMEAMPLIAIGSGGTNGDAASVHYGDEIDDLGKRDGTINMCNDMQASREDRKGPDMSSDLKDYEANSLTLRPALLEMSKNAVSSEVENIMTQIIKLLNDAGGQDGAEGISRVASLLIDGRESGSNASVKSQNSDTTESVVFPDSLISSLSKVYIREMTSAARVSIFLASFVLPSITALAPEKSRPASRQLVTVLTFLAKLRPAECIHSLMVPTLIGKANQSLVSEAVSSEASKAQCELMNRLVKSSSFPSNELTNLIEEIVLVKWTELTISVMTTILQKKPTLRSITIRRIAGKIEACSNDEHFTRSTKFSSFFHSFVIKYGSQIQTEESCEMLFQAASALKTILRKSIISTLRNFQKS